MSNTTAWCIVIIGCLVLFAVWQLWWTRRHNRNLDEHNRRMAEIQDRHTQRMRDLHARHGSGTAGGDEPRPDVRS